MILQPGNVHVVGRICEMIKQRIRSDGERRRGPAVAPATDFGMPVRERETASKMMIHAWKIPIETVQRRVGGGVAPHVGHKIAPVDAVFSHVQKNKDFA